VEGNKNASILYSPPFSMTVVELEVYFSKPISLSLSCTIIFAERQGGDVGSKPQAKAKRSFVTRDYPHKKHETKCPGRTSFGSSAEFAQLGVTLGQRGAKRQPGLGSTGLTTSPFMVSIFFHAERLGSGIASSKPWV
jgi:hypothetical protein